MSVQQGGCPGDPCEEKLTELRLLIDNELDDDGCDQVRRHVQDCPPCSEQADLESRLRQLVHRGCTGEDAPAQLRARVLAAITEITSVHFAQTVRSDGNTINVQTVHSVSTVRQVVTPVDEPSDERPDDRSAGPR